MPKEILDEPEDMDVESSTASDLDETNEAAEAAAPEANADSSTATDETEVDTLSVVRDVVAAQQEEQTEAAPSAEGEEGSDADDATNAEQDDENYSDVPFHTHPRFQQLLRKAKTYENDARLYRNVESFLEANNLEAQEAADVMEIAGLAKMDPQEAWKRVKPWVQNLLVAAGEVLPQDLAQRVANKELSQEAALELSRSRAQLASRDARQQIERQRGERQQQSQQVQVLVDTAEAWVAGRRKRDPNFAAKEDRVYERVAFLQRTEGKPNTADGVKAQLQKAYEFVNKQQPATPKPAQAAPAAAAAPAARRPALKPVTGGQVASNAQQPKPTSTLEVIRQHRAARATA